MGPSRPAVWGFGHRNSRSKPRRGDSPPSSFQGYLSLSPLSSLSLSLYIMCIDRLVCMYTYGILNCYLCTYTHTQTHHAHTHRHTDTHRDTHTWVSGLSRFSMVAFCAFFPSFLCFCFDDILFLKKNLEEFFTSLMIATILILTRKNLRVSSLILLL